MHVCFFSLVFLQFVFEISSITSPVLGHNFNETVENINVFLDNTLSLLHSNAHLTTSVLNHIRRSTGKEGDINALLSVSTYVTRSFADVVETILKDLHDKALEQYDTFVNNIKLEKMQSKVLNYVISMESTLVDITPVFEEIIWRNRRRLTILFNDVAGRMMNLYHKKDEHYRKALNVILEYESTHLTRIVNELGNQLAILFADTSSKFRNIL